MDDRTTQHAKLLVEYCTAVEPADNVLVKAPTAAENLAIALYEQLGEQGARPMLSWRNPRASRAYLRAANAKDIRTKDHELAAMEETDVVFLIKGARNAAETSDVDPEIGKATSSASQPVLEQRLDTRWVITQHPTPADAQRSDMSTPAWTDYVYDAILQDWEARREVQQQVANELETGEEIRIVAGDTTDLRLSVSGMAAYNDDGTENMPGGEVATSPVVDSVEGRVAFDFPVRRYGHEIEGAWLEIEEGEVVDYGAEKNEETLTNTIETDTGAQRVGELGIGMNRGIDRISHNILFDEKMGDTAHIALGQAMEECVPEDETFNESAIHLDMLVDMSEDSRIEVDGSDIQRDGTFWFEEGF